MLKAEKIVTTGKSALRLIAEKLLYPFKDDLPYFILLLVLNLYICFGVILIESGPYFFISTILCVYVMTYNLVFLVNINKYIGFYILKPLLLIINNAIFVLTAYCWCKYRSRSAIQIIAGTNLNEIREFIMMYSSWTMVVLVAILTVLASVILYLGLSKIRFKASKRLWLPMSIFLIISYISVVFGSKWIPDLYDFAGMANIAYFRYNPTNPEIKSEEEQPAYIIIIIGESFTPLHSSVYGYDKKTNPLLEEKANEGELIVFNKITSPKTTTSASFTYMLNTFRIGMEETHKWYDCTNLIEVLNVAGYHTIWISNQERDGICCNLPSGHSQLCEESAFLSEGSDGDIPDEIVLDFDVTDSYATAAVFYHLMGQHPAFYCRYPEAYDIFKPSDYRCEEWQQANMAEYDNATLYNDYVVNSIIEKYKDYDTAVFYLSDHGFDVYVTDPVHCGHGNYSPESEVVGKKIPFMVYLSPLYQKRRPELTERIRNSVNNEFCTDKLIYAVMDAAGFKFADNDDVAEYSLFGPSITDDSPAMD